MARSAPIVTPTSVESVFGIRGSIVPKLLEAMKKIDGFPLETTMGAGVTMQVTKVEQRPIPESEFTVPAGYTKVPSKISRAGTEED